MKPFLRPTIHPSKMNTKPPFSTKPVRLTHDTPLDLLIQNVIQAMSKNKIAALGPRLYPVLRDCLSELSITADKTIVLYVLRKVWPIGYEKEDFSDWADQFLCDWQQYEDDSPVVESRKHVPAVPAEVSEAASKIIDDIDSMSYKSDTDDDDSKSVSLGSKDTDDNTDDDDDDIPDAEDEAFIDDTDIDDAMHAFAEYVKQASQDTIEHVSTLVPHCRIVALSRFLCMCVANV